MLRIIGALGLVAALAMALYLTHRRPPNVPADDHGAATAASTDAPRASGPAHLSEAEILANCHPHLAPNNSTSVPNIDVSARPNPAAVRLNVRFWVDGNGFVTKAFYLGRTVYSTEEAEDAVHYTKGLTFTVPNTAECRVRQMELIGNFAEALGQTGEWSTVFEMHPRFSYVGGYMRESR